MNNVRVTDGNVVYAMIKTARWHYRNGNVGMWRGLMFWANEMTIAVYGRGLSASAYYRFKGYNG